MALGKIRVDQIESSTQVINVDDIGLSSGVSDGNKGDITVSSSGTVWSVNDGAVALNELSDVTLTSPSDGQSLSYNASTGQWVNSTPAGGGTVTSVGLVAPTGFSVSGSPVTTSGNITLSFAAGYSLPTTASQANWDTAYSERLYWDGGATGLNASTGRTSLGLGNSATLNVGTTAGTVAAGDALGNHVAAADPHPNYALESSLGGAALLNVGTTTGTVAAGDDARFTTDLSYTAATRVLASSTGADATLPLFTSTDAGLVPGSGGGTANFLRADGTWASPPAGSGGITDGDKGDITVSDSGATWLIDAGVVDTSNLGGDITTAGKALLDDADAAAQRTTLGLATVASTGAYSDLSGTPSIPAAADATPQPLGTAAIGASTDYAREDHVHAMPSAADVGADASGTAASAISTHEAAADPHPGYALESSLGGAALLNVGTTTGTVAAGDDSRFVPAGGTTGQALIKSSGTDYDASWQNITTAIDDLTDVTITSVADGEVLTYDSATSQWINATPTGGGGTPGGTTGQLQWNSSGSFAGVGSSTVGATGDITLSLNGAADTPPLKLTGTWFTGGTSTTTKPQLLIEPTGTTSTAWSTSGTGLGINAPSTFLGDMLHLQHNGNSRARITHAGVVEATGQSYNFAAFKFRDYNSGISHWTQGHIGIIRQDVLGLLFTGTDHIIGGSQTFAWSSGTPGLATTDIYLCRDAAGALAQRNSANAQTFRCYGTYTDASNYVRAALSSTSTAVTLAAETAGTGADDIPLNLTAAGTGTVKINSVAEVASSSTVAGLPTSPVVGMITRVTDASFPTLGATVSGGGAAAALVWYNGANWTVLGV